ncbi:hypothetical protein V6N13_109832 [Hibiscus sabdariffa]
MILAVGALCFHAREDSGMSVGTSNRCSCGVCQSKTSSMDKFMGSIWPASLDGSAADAAAGGGVVWPPSSAAGFGVREIDKKSLEYLCLLNELQLSGLHPLQQVSELEKLDGWSGFGGLGRR